MNRNTKRQWHVIMCIAIAFICISAIAFHNQALESKTTQSTHQITSIIYDGRTAYRLSDGRTEAVIVPEIGRVMRYGFVGSSNVLWNSTQKNFNKNEWRNWGGDKTWAAPQLWWSAMSGRDWPPDEVWDGSPHKARILSNGHLQTTSEVTSGMGARTVREYWFEKNGDFTIQQTVEKVTGELLLLSIWNVTQIMSPDAIFVPLNPKSPYKQNFHWITPVKNGSPVVYMTPTLLQLRPSIDNDYKIGADSPVAALAAVKDGIAMVERSERPPGNYPDGAVGGGFPVEVYSQGDSKIAYSELELLSPLRLLKKGDRFEHIIHWSLHQLPSRDVNSQRTRVAVEKLLAS